MTFPIFPCDFPWRRTNSTESGPWELAGDAPKAWLRARWFPVTDHEFKTSLMGMKHVETRTNAIKHLPTRTRFLGKRPDPPRDNPPMTTCVYDNPATMAREAWMDGALVAHITADTLCSATFRGGDWFPFYLNVGRWKTGKLVGNADAMRPPMTTEG